MAQPRKGRRKQITFFGLSRLFKAKNRFSNTFWKFRKPTPSHPPGGPVSEGSHKQRSTLCTLCCHRWCPRQNQRLLSYLRCVGWLSFSTRTILLELTTHLLNHTRKIMSACLQMQINSVVGASTNIGFQNKQQRLKSLNLSGTDVSKVSALAPLPPFWWHILVNNRYSHNSQWKVQYQDHSWFDLPGGSQVACCRNCETERDNSHLHMSHFVWVSLISLFRLAFFREQIKEMLLALSNSPTNLSLTKLNIGGNDLSGKYFASIKTQARSCYKQ